MVLVHTVHLKDEEKIACLNKLISTIPDCYCDLESRCWWKENVIKTKENQETAPNSGFGLLYAQTIQQSRDTDFFNGHDILIL